MRSKLGVRGVFRAGVLVFMATVRLWKSTPAGLISYLEAMMKRAEVRSRHPLFVHVQAPL